MATTTRWASRGEADLIALVRLRCYGAVMKDLPKFRQMFSDDQRSRDGDYLLLERDGEAVGTATSLSFPLHLRGAAMPCQGVAWVGTIKTARRRHGGASDAPAAAGPSPDRGVATQVMHATLDRARERGEVVSALMPFRASFYEHFGYGVVERRCTWTIPLSILPRIDTAGIAFFDESDLPAMARCRTREAIAGACDIDAGLAGLRSWRPNWDDGLVVVDRDQGGEIHAWAWFGDETRDGRRFARVMNWSADSHASLLKLLAFFGTLKDQHSGLIVQLPIDLPIHRLLRESQVPHRPIDHPASTVQSFTRMQVRVLDHARFLEAQRFDPSRRAKAVVAIHECEGHRSTLALDLGDGRMTATPSTATPDVEMSDVLWASIASGDLPIATATRLGLVRSGAAATDLLGAFDGGRTPWCGEYF
jgi:hypothetical protein